MKILQINSECGTGSIGRLMFELADSLQEQGHECIVAYSLGSPNFNSSYKIGTYIDHKFHALLSRITGLQGYFSRNATRKLLQVIKEYKPDIVHLHNLHSNYINLSILLGYLAHSNIATVITLHDCWFYTGKCTHYVSANCDKWKDSCGNCPLLHKDYANPTFFFDRTHKCLMDKKKWFDAIPQLAVVGVSQWVANEAKESILGKRRPISIYNWIDSNVFYQRKSNLRQQFGLENRFVVLMVATCISEIKGYNVMKNLSKRLSENYQIVIVGKNKWKLDIPNNVIHIPHTDDANQLAEYYSMADICVNTTKYETFGKVTAESLCCGTPVIVYNNTASPELVGEKCGYVVNERDGIEAVLKAIRKVKEIGKEYYSNHCIEFAENKFDRNKGVKAYEKLYEKLIAEVN